MRRLALLTVALIFAACSDGDTSVASSASPRTGAGGSDVTAASVAAFSDGIVRSPAWGTVRRAGPPDVRSMREAQRGTLKGQFVGLSLADPVPTDASELVGKDVEVRPGTEDGTVLDGPPVTSTLALQSVVLEVSVESTSGDFAVGGRTVGVPFVLWTSADAGETQQRILGDLFARLEASAPLGADVLVLAADVDSTSGKGLVVTPGHRVYGSLASVVFDTSDAGLVSLDPLVGDAAENYFGASTLGEIQESLG